MTDTVDLAAIVAEIKRYEYEAQLDLSDVQSAIDTLVAALADANRALSLERAAHRATAAQRDDAEDANQEWVAFRASQIDQEAKNAIDCLRGHPLSGANLYIRTDGDRECRECKRQRASIRHKQCPELRKEAGRRYRQAHAALRAETQRRYREKNREAVLENQRRYRARKKAE